MYKVLLCWRYLRTRLIALPSVVSVMLGVATIIIVNSVMGGFAKEMRGRIRGAYADVMITARSRTGFPDYQTIIDRVKQDLGPRIVAIAPVIQTYGLVTYDVPGGRDEDRNEMHVVVFGVDAEARTQMGKLGQWVQEGRKSLLEAYALSTKPAKERRATPLLYHFPGWPLEKQAFAELEQRVKDNAPPSYELTETTALMREGYYRLFWHGDRYKHRFDKGKLDKPFAGVLVGMQLAGGRYDRLDYFFTGPGLDLVLTVPSNDVTGEQPGSYRMMVVADVFKSGMSEYDSKFVYMPFKALQQMREMDGSDGKAPRTDSIHIMLDDYKHHPEVTRRIGEILVDVLGSNVAMTPKVETWEQKNTPILAAVTIELTILNILLFFIIAVAGFGILAIFAMIVVEKTRDIGILKALGGSNRGVMSIFLGYGVALGAVGSGLGLTLAIVFITYLDWIEQTITRLTGHEVFDRNIYYFPKIPRDPDPWMMAWVVAGAILISVLASVYPAWRASRLNPVEALRHE